MQWIMAIFGFFFPRLAIAVLALTTTYMSRAFETTIWPVLGFLFMPFTTLAWALAKNEHGSVSGVWLAIVVIAVLMDLGIVRRGAKKKQCGPAGC